jgi:hydrogenase expression/formation protein HypC
VTSLCGRAALQGRDRRHDKPGLSPGGYAGGSFMCLAVPGRVVEIIDGGDIAFRVGKVDFGGIRKDVNLAYTPEAEVGKYVLVHVGFAISVIDEAEAQRVFQYLEEMGGLKEEFGEIPQ